MASRGQPLATEQITQAHKRLQQTLRTKREELQRLERFEAEYAQLDGLLSTFSDSIFRPAMVPFGPLAFFPGKLVRTNELLVSLGDNYFAKCTASHARSILDRRRKYVDEQLSIMKKERRELYARLGLTSNILGCEESNDYVEIREEYESDEEIDEYNHDEEEEADQNLVELSTERTEEEKARWDYLEKLIEIESQTQDENDRETCSTDLNQDFSRKSEEEIVSEANPRTLFDSFKAKASTDSSSVMHDNRRAETQLKASKVASNPVNIRDSEASSTNNLHDALSEVVIEEGESNYAIAPQPSQRVSLFKAKRMKENKT